MPSSNNQHISLRQASVEGGGVSPYVWYVTGAVSTLVGVVIIVSAVVVWLKVRSKKSSSGLQRPNHQIRVPEAQLTTLSVPATVQPQNPSSLESWDGGGGGQICKNKRKGLLERRGANNSLRITLAEAKSSAGTDEKSSLSNGPPPPFISRSLSTCETLLVRASRRMTRKQLRHCLENTKLIYADFWGLPTNHPDVISVPCSGTKNRYKTILPNEETRVVLPELPGEPLSSYINANFITGYNGESRAYIATQGPMTHTLEDFWRMVWQERCPAVIMLTRLHDRNKNKCTQYLPEYEGVGVTYGDFRVSVHNPVLKDGYRVLTVALERGGEVRAVQHYWHTAWPDHSAPSSARQLLRLATDVEALRTRHSRPLVVHCSAGIGRTGCFIATSIGLQQQQREGSVDILSIVARMRLDRGGMVQTNEQYEFIHRALTLCERELPPHSDPDTN